mgnify:CR=1 FL=1
MADYENKLCEAIELIVENAVASANYDRTIKATIVSCVDQSIGKFKVKYQDSSFYAYATSSEVTYTKGKEVYVLIPGNDMSADKTILGTTEKLGADYAVEPEGDEAYEVVGTNCIHSSSTFELCSYVTAEEILYEKDEINKINVSISSLEEYVKKSSSLICGATFKTNLPTEQQFRGNYGIVFELVFLDNATEENVTRNYVVDVNQMSGNPYKITHDTRQYGVFDIDGENFQYINKIYIFAYDFPNKASDKPNDIFIKDIELSGANLLSSEELSACALTFVTPQGTFFDENDTDKSIRTIQAQVRVKGKVIDENSQALDYYWFVENIGITSLSEYYCKYGGSGWKCLNDHNIVKPQEGNNAAVVEWVPGSYQLQVLKEDSLAKETRYKCVAIYNDTTTVTKEIIITNYSSEYDITIESDSGTQFYYDIGRPTLTCKINGAEKSGDEFSYAWAQIDNNNNYFSLAETTDYNEEYNTAVRNYNNLQNQIKNEIKLAAASQDELNRYKEIIDSYNNITRVETNKVFKIGINEITNFATFKCAVYYNGVYIGTGSITLTNTLDVEDAYSLVINNGSQVFKYNEAGVAPTSDTLENPQIIEPLTFTIYDNLGQPIDDEIISKSVIKWIVPTTNTMINIPSSYQPESVDEINGTETYTNLLGISYTIDRNYNVKNTNNNIKLIVEYKDMSLVANTDFVFAKEGEPGTNGTEFLCKIVPNTENKPLYPMILNGKLNYTPRQSNRWFQIQLWHNGEKIFESTSSGNSTENKNVVVTWSILRNKYNIRVSDNSDITINSTTGACTYSGYTNNSTPANIIKCSVRYDGCDYYATMPLITAKSNDGYSVSLKDYTGFRYATYTTDGRTPSYDNTNPFELLVTQIIDGYTEDISELTSTYSVDYDWRIRGKIYNPDTEEWDSSFHLGVNNISNLKRNQKSIKPLDDYDGECLNNGLECIITRNNSEVARIHIPIHLLLNKYGNAAINGWDGNSVSVDENGSGVILAPQVGAGQKESDNSFTGMLMGKVKESGKSETEVGLFGYNFGVRSLFLNSKDGSAIFGKYGKGQMIIDPAADQALLYSTNYWKNYKSDGKPTTYSSSNENGEGMLIDLTTPQIKWGNENFSVDKDGHVIAKGGGSIAGWEINDTQIFKNDVYIDSSRQAIFSNNKNAMIATSDGFYIGSDGFALGPYSNSKGHSPFQVNSEGSLFSNLGSIGGFTIADNTLIGGSGSNTVGMSSKSGIQWAFWSGADNAEDAPFHVGHNGELHSTRGTIGGWTINSNTLTGGNMTINSNGSLSGPNWSIEEDGDATFNNVRITQNAYVRGQNLIDFINFKVDSAGNMSATNAYFSGNINGSSISGGSLSGASISGGSVTGSTISGGSISIHKGSYYLEMGLSTDHPRVSGLNVDGGGINMHGGGISACDHIGVNEIRTHNSGSVHVNTAFYADEALYYMGYDGSYHQVAGLYDWYSGGKSDYIDILDADGSTKLRLTFSYGLYKGYTRL